ncbi:unnamed protein product [Allacma fusca]|uniref:BTB domain-containing protein n=1 Tax=Allacma fusca TaxID=39272 RepID=A0A8J2JP07_9HEXA|nr:unnamed protein product [Allacma fusca]
MQWEDAIIDLMENGREDDDRNVILLVGPEGSAKKFVLSRTVVRLTSEVFEDLLSRDTGPSNTYKIPDMDPGLFQHVVRVWE